MRFERYPNVQHSGYHRLKVTWWGLDSRVWCSSYYRGRLTIELGPLAICVGRRKV